MFSSIIARLQRGELPTPTELRSRVTPAVAKKSGVLHQPRACWSNDPKINPDGVHLLWAAILLGDLDEISLVTGLLFVEQGNSLDEFTPAKAGALLLAASSPLLELAPNHSFRAVLSEKIREAAASLDPR